MKSYQASFFIGIMLFCIGVSFALSPYELADEDSLFIDIFGIDIHYKVEGNADKAMLMFHGFGSSTFTWGYIKDAFVHDFTLVAYDRPAFGLTERIVDVDDYGYNFYSFYNQSEIAHEVMLSLGLNPKDLFLVGHSAGTPIALDYYLQYPDKVKGLVLVSPALFHNLDENPFAKTFSNPLVRGTVSLFRNLLARTLERGLDESWYDPSKITDEIRNEYKKFTQIDDWEKALIEFTLNQGDFNLLPTLIEVDIPVLVVFGMQDEIVGKDDVLTQIRDNPNITVVLLEETGHVPHEERPGEVVQSIKHWMEALSLN